LVDGFKKNKAHHAFKGIVDIIEYDARIRELVVQKGGLDPEMIDFIFGRPVKETIKRYGVELRKQAGKYHLVRIR
jgi:hypothetical protein